MAPSGSGTFHRRALLTTAFAGGTALLSSSGQAALSRRAPFDRVAYDRYVSLMNASDTGFAEYYADDIQFVMNIRGKAAVIDFYKRQWAFVKERLSVQFFCSDANGAAAEVLSELRCLKDYNDGSTFGRPLKAGEVQRVRGYIFYELNVQGRITRIKGPPPEILSPWRLEPA